MTIITDRHHLHRRANDAHAAIDQLVAAWIAEDEAATQPASNSHEPTGGGGPSDPTLTVATRPRRTRHRDRLGADLHRAIQQLEQLAEDTQPRHTGGPCRCCQRDTATHGRDHEGRPSSCYRCWTFLRKIGRRCNEADHETRDYRRMCECPPACCDVCPEDADEGRTLSRRCRGRKERGLWLRDDTG